MSYTTVLHTDDYRYPFKTSKMYPGLNENQINIVQFGDFMIAFLKKQVSFQFI